MAAKRPPDVWLGLDLNWHSKVRAAAERVTRWYNTGSGALILAGDPGCGKTHIAEAIFKMYGGPGYIIDWSSGQAETVSNAVMHAEPDLFSLIKSGYGGKGKSSDEILAACRRSKLLIIDDLGVAYVKEESTAWAQDIYWKIFDSRVDKFTLITTNWDKFQWSARIGRRAVSRLMQALGGEDAIIDLFGVPDYRQKDWK